MPGADQQTPVVPPAGLEPASACPMRYFRRRYKDEDCIIRTQTKERWAILKCIEHGRLTIQTAEAFPRPWRAGMGGTISGAPGIEPGQGTSAPTWAANFEQSAAPPGRAQSRKIERTTLHVGNGSIHFLSFKFRALEHPPKKSKIKIKRRVHLTFF